MAEKISFKFLGDAKDLIDATRGANRGLESTEDASSRTDRALGGMDDTIRNMAIGIGAAEIGQFALNAIHMADEAEALADSARTVLGPELDTLHDNLSGLREMMGLNIGELDGLAAQFGLLTESMGLSDEQQREFVEQLVITGGDLAAFNGDVGATQEAIESLAGAYKGEFDSLENWGIKINAAAVEQRELELRADDANDALSDQQIELQAITELINEAAAPALGALADAEDDSATKASVLKTKWEDLQILLGNFLSPALEWFLDLILNAVDALQRLTDKQEFWNTRLGHWYKALDDFTRKVLEPFRVAVLAIRDAFQWLIDKVKEAVGWLDRIKIPDLPGWVPFVGGDGGSPKKTIGGGVLQTEAASFAPTPQGSPATGGGIVINVTAGVGDPQAIARKLVEVLQVYQQTNGAIPITVTKSEESI